MNWNRKELRKGAWNTVFKRGTMAWLALVAVCFIFAFLGFEHVIANFSSFSLAFFAFGGALPGMTVGSVLTNWFFAMIGNYIGGGLLIGLLYAWMNKDSEVYVD